MYVRVNEPTCTVCIESPGVRAGEGQGVELVARLEPLLDPVAFEAVPVLDVELVAERDVAPTVPEPDADGVDPVDPGVEEVEP
jgi:hypothetical protein